MFDTTIINLPDELKEVWQVTLGTGPTTRAAVKGEIGFDLKSGHLIGPFLLPGKTNDSKGRLPQTVFPKNSLEIKDLAYFSTKKMKELDETNRFYLSRLKHDTVLFNENNELFDLSSYARHREKKNIYQTELKVLLGKRDRTKARLFIQRVPEAVAAVRENKPKNGLKNTVKSFPKKACYYMILLS